MSQDFEDQFLPKIVEILMLADGFKPDKVLISRSIAQGTNSLRLIAWIDLARKILNDIEPQLQDKNEDG
jgi:hypothetical protein